MSTSTGGGVQQAAEATKEHACAHLTVLTPLPYDRVPSCTVIMLIVLPLYEEQ